MNIVFVSPPFHHSDMYAEWDLSAVDSVSPPVGLLYLAAYVRSRGHQVSVLDARILGLSHKEAAQRVMERHPDIVGLSAMTPSIFSAAEVASLVKTMDRNVITVIGGPHITAVPEETMRRFPEFDIGCIGEGEITVAALLEVLERGVSLEEVPGLIIRTQGGLRRTPWREPLTNLDLLPFPAWDLLPSLSAYSMSIVGTTNKLSTGLITSRGCPAHCSFCDLSVSGHKVRSHSPEYVVAMIEHLYHQYGVRDFLIYDDNFVGLKKRVVRIFELLRGKGLGITWSCETRIDTVDEELLQFLAQNGCWQIDYGIESGSPEILKAMNKRLTLDKVAKALRWTKQAGIMARGNFIFGYLGETHETLKQTIEFALKLDLDYFQQTFLTPYPGSAIYEIAAQYGDFDGDWRKMSNLYINFVPHGLTKGDLVRYSKSAFLRFYLRPKIIWRHLRRVRDYESFCRLLKAFGAFLKSVSPLRRERGFRGNASLSQPGLA